MKPSTGIFAQLFEVRLDPNVVRDVINIAFNHPTTIKCFSQFNALILCRPFKVTLKSFAEAIETPEFKRHIEMRWMPWVRNLFLWRQVFGIIPWRIMYDTGPDGKRFWYPEIPDMDAGYITTGMEERQHKQFFHFYWHGQAAQVMSKPAPMFWSHCEWQPTCAGTIRSPLHSLLVHFRTERIVRASTELAVYHAARPYYFWLQKSTPMKDTMSTLPGLGDMGEDVVGTFDKETARRFHDAAHVHTAAFENEISRVSMQKNAKQAQITLPMLYSESAASVMAREGNSVAERSFYMPPDWELVKPPEPKVIANLDDFDERLTRQICEVMGIPQELTQSGAKTTAGAAGMFFIMNERVKMETAWLRMQIEYAMLVCYGEDWDNGLDEIKRRIVPKASEDAEYTRFLQQTAKTELVVNLDCAPLLTGEQAKELWRDGFMNKEDAAHILQGQYLIPDDLIHVLSKADRDFRNEKDKQQHAQQKPTKKPKTDVTEASHIEIEVRKGNA